MEIIINTKEVIFTHQFAYNKIQYLLDYPYRTRANVNDIKRISKFYYYFRGFFYLYYFILYIFILVMSFSLHEYLLS